MDEYNYSNWWCNCSNFKQWTLEGDSYKVCGDVVAICSYGMDIDEF